MPNITDYQPPFFRLLGFPGLESSYVYIGFIFFLVYVTSVTGNVTLLYIIRIDLSLHKPMYFFLCMLSFVDLVLTSSTTPKTLGILWFNSQEIYVDACLTQMFFIHSFATMQSSILLAMAFDRFLAICHPLRYTSLLTNRLIFCIGLGFVLRGVVLVMPLPILFKRLSLCMNNSIYNSFCDHIAVVKLVCSDASLSSLYGLVVVIIVVAVDLTFIIWSYILILLAVFRLPSRESRSKALSTCASHICVLLVFYLTVALLSVVQRFGKNFPVYVVILLSNVYLMLPSFVNPIVYGLKTKQVRNRIKKLLPCNVKDNNCLQIFTRIRDMSVE